MSNSVEEEKVILTTEGKKKYESRLRHLLDVKRPKVIEQLQEARQQGDLSENADYDAARDLQSKIEGEIKQIETILSNSRILNQIKIKSDKIQIGSIVTIKKDSAKRTLQIVGSYEADPDAEPYAKIANNTPLGKALIGLEKGSKSIVKTLKPYEIEIIEVK